MEKSLFNNLRIKILILVVTTVLVTTLSSIFIAYFEVTNTMSHSEERHAQNMLNQVYLTIKSKSKSIKFHKKALYEERKQQLKKLTTVAQSAINSQLNLLKQKRIPLTTAQKRAIQQIQKMRYDNGIGYFWINDISRPFAKMIMHPIFPDLNGKVLDSPKFNCALGKNKNLFNAFVDVCLKDKEGYVDYLWPKPNPEGVSKDQPKLSYVTLIPEWNWILGTGIYVDDIEAQLQKKKNAVYHELLEIIKQIKLIKSGYMVLFDSDKKVLIHPNKLQRTIKINDETPFHAAASPKSIQMLDKIITAYKNGHKKIQYLWEHPSDLNNYIYNKIAYINYYEPFDLYMVATIYEDEINASGQNLVVRIIIYNIVILIIALFLGLLLSMKISNPLNKLVKTISNINKDNLANVVIPVEGSDEIQQLANTLNEMITSINTAESIIRKTEQDQMHELELLVNQRTKELSNKNNELEKTINQLVDMKEQLVSREKLASLGILTAGIAHELKNPLNIINNGAYVLGESLKELSDDPSFKGELAPLIEASTLILKHGKKADRIIKSMLAQAKTTDQEKSLFSLNELIENGVNLSYHSMRTRYSFNVKINLDLDPIDKYYLYGQDLERVIINLCENSFQAMYTKKEKSDDNYRPLFTISQKNDAQYTTIIVRDNGVGIKQADIPDIYTPFFTTKSAGLGTGLGLSLAHDVINKHGGNITLNSNENEYTEFIITLPLQKELMNDK